VTRTLTDRDACNSSMRVLFASFVLGTHNFLQKIAKNALVGLMTFWLGLIKILSYKDLWTE